MHSCVNAMPSVNTLLLTAVLTMVLFCAKQVYAEVYEMNLNASQSTQPRALLSKSDEYITQNRRNCLDSRSVVSCIKYKASKVFWKLATNNFGFFPNEHGRELRDENYGVRVVHLAEPSEITMFDDVENRSSKGDSELQKIIKFLKRAFETFGQNHAIQLSLNGDSGVRVSSGEVEEGRGKKKRKWLIILPLIILWKIAHLKMTVVTLLLGVLGLNVLLVGGTGWIIHYLKFKTLCKIHPHFVQSHSHVYDSDPAEYSSFVGSSFSGSYHNGFGSSPHEVNVAGYGKDWGGNSKAYNGYNYLDTISRRVQ